MGKCLSSFDNAESHRTSRPSSSTSFDGIAMEEWEIIHVYQWLFSLENGSFQTWAEQFEEQGVNGLMLMGMNAQYLKRRGMTSDEATRIIRARDGCHLHSHPMTPNEETAQIQPAHSIFFTPLHNDHEDKLKRHITYTTSVPGAEPLQMSNSAPTPEPVDTQKPLDPLLLHDLVEFGLGTSSSFYTNSKSPSKYRQKGKLISHFAADPNPQIPDLDTDKTSRLRPQITAAQQLNVNAAEYMPLPQYPFTRSQSAPNPSKLYPIDETQPVQSQQTLCVAEHQKRRKCGNTKHKHVWKRLGLKGNIKVSRDFTEITIPKQINVNIPNLFEYMDKVTMLQSDNAIIGIEYKKNKNVRILNYDFYDKDTNKALYCVADVCFGSPNFKWQMREKLYTEKRIMKEMGSDCVIPKSWRNESGFTEQKSEQKMVEDEIGTYSQPILSKYKWTKTSIHCKRNNKQRLVLAMNKEEFIRKLAEYIEKHKDTVETVPIVVFDATAVHIEYVYVVRIRRDPSIDIGISYRVVKERVAVSSIYLNKDDILNAHMLISPHNCHCLNGFKSVIDALLIGNPDDDKNKIKDLKNKWNALKCRVRELESENAALSSSADIDSPVNSAPLCT